MISFAELANSFDVFLPVLTTIIVILVVYLVFSIILETTKRRLLKVVKKKKQISNIKIFSRTIRYVFLFLLILVAIFSYSGDWAGLGLTLGLFSAAIGFALQKPISGIAAWIMVVTRRPFDIGDRIIIGDVRGDVTDISLTHITLKEIGGIVPSEENSGRFILVPNNLLFEKNVINYTQQDEFIMDQVITTVTYESNLDKAMRICLDSAKKLTAEFSEKLKKEPYLRTYFQPNGINVYVRFFVPAKRMQEYSSGITREIFNRIRKENEVEIAYPHTEVLLRQKPSKRQSP